MCAERPVLRPLSRGAARLRQRRPAGDRPFSRAPTRDHRQPAHQSYNALEVVLLEHERYAPVSSCNYRELPIMMSRHSVGHHFGCRGLVGTDAFLQLLSLGGKSDFQCPKTGHKLTKEGPVFRPFSGRKNRGKDRGLPPVFFAQQPG